MTTFDAREVREAVSMPEAIAAVRNAFLDLALGRFQTPIRTVLADGAFLVMPTHHRPTASAAVKTLSLDFTRIPAITGTVVWSRSGTADHVLADAAAVTALRTGAGTGVATDLLAPAGASRLVLIGYGAQAADQVRGVHTVRPLRELTVVGRDTTRAEALLAHLAPELPDVTLRVETDPAAALRNADIVCCATTATAPLFATSALPPAVHVNAIGSYRPSMRELPEDLLTTATVVVDERAAALEESGEIIDALVSGAISADSLHELGAALAAPRFERAERTVFKSVGLAVQDWAIMRLLAERGQQP